MKNLNLSAAQIKNKIKEYSKAHSISYDRVMTLFLLERVAYLMSQNSFLSERLIFKGGYVNVRVYSSPRYTTDLDAISRGTPSENIEKEVIKCLTQNDDSSVWFKYESTAKLKTQTPDGGIRIIFRADIGDQETKTLSHRSRLINLDIGSGDVVVPKPIKEETPLIIGEDHISWFVYPVETTVAEKLHCWVNLGSMNSRSKDIYDMSMLLPKCSPQDLVEALTSTFKQRGLSYGKQKISKIIKETDTSLLRRGWKNATAGLKKTCYFDECVEFIIKYLENNSI